MAFSFTTQPSTRGQSVRSPLIYAVQETTANDDYKYVLDVYIHDSAAATTGTPDYRLVCSPDGSNIGKFDVSKIVNSALEPNYAINSASLTSAKDVGTGCRHITTQGGFIDDSGVASYAQATSSAFANMCTQGYLDFDDAVNKGWYSTTEFLSSQPRATSASIKIPESAIFYMPVATNIITSASYSTDDGTTGSVSIPSTATVASERIKYIPIGTRQLSLPTGVQWYEVTFNSVGVDSYTFRFEVTCEPKYDYYTLMFLNRYGLWDYLYFFKKSTDTTKVERESYRRINPLNTYYPEYRTFNVSGRDSVTLNTGFVDEAFNDVYKELMLSEHIMLVEKNGVTIQQPVTLSESELTYKTGVNDQLINYTMTFDKAYKVINSRW